MKKKKKMKTPKKFNKIEIFLFKIASLDLSMCLTSAHNALYKICSKAHDKYIGESYCLV